MPVPGEVEALVRPVRDEERMRRVALSEERTECHDSLDITTFRRLRCMVRAYNFSLKTWDKDKFKFFAQRTQRHTGKYWGCRGVWKSPFQTPRYCGFPLFQQHTLGAGHNDFTKNIVKIW